MSVQLFFYLFSCPGVDCNKKDLLIPCPAVYSFTMKKQTRNVNCLWFWRQVRKEWNKFSSGHSCFICNVSDSFARGWRFSQLRIQELAQEWLESSGIPTLRVNHGFDGYVLFPSYSHPNHSHREVRDKFIRAMCKKFSQKWDGVAWSGAPWVGRSHFLLNSRPGNVKK